MEGSALAVDAACRDCGPSCVARLSWAPVRQALQAGCLHELVCDLVPVVLREGERIFDDVPDLLEEAVEASTSPLATRIVYKIT
jgi:hypothetical protein